MENETVDYGKVTGMVHSTESFGAVDGPGIRFIVLVQFPIWDYLSCILGEKKEPATPF